MNLDDYIQKRMKDPEFKEAYEELLPEYEMKLAIIRARMEAGYTQKELSVKSGIPQSDISRMENGTYNPSVKTLRKLAAGMGMMLKIEFVSPQKAGIKV